MQALETIALKSGNVANIYHDEDAESPREYDNLGKMICFHRRYILGDDHDLKTEDFSGWDEMEDHLREELGAVVVLPLYLYDHSGITISVNPFGCPWDSGQIGFIYADEEMIRKVLGKASKGNLEEIRRALVSEVETYDQFIRGEVFYFEILDPDGNFLDGCGGFFGEDYVRGTILDEWGPEA